MKLFAVTGNPILHSLSPTIFNYGFKALSFEGKYLLLASSSAKEAFRVAKEMGLSGLNITSPFKEEAFFLVDEMDQVAAQVGAINTVVFDRGNTKGFNTDVEGVRSALVQNGVQLQGKRIAIVGAGGSAMAACYALSPYGPVTVFNRSMDKAERVAKRFRCHARGLSEIHLLREMDVIVFCLPTEFPIHPSFLRPGQVILRANYREKAVFEAEAYRAGIRVIDGKEWLFFQALKPFELFTSLSAPQRELREALYIERKKKGVICLTGFMGSGKTAVGKALAERLSLPFLDMDERIEKRTGMTVEEIFEREGEEAFRRLEQEEVEATKGIKEAVIALGGGAVVSERTRRLLDQNFLVLWLWTRKETILERLYSDHKRPLLKGDKEKAIEELLQRRIPLYAMCAHMVVPTDGKSPEQVAERIIKELKYGG